MYLLFYHILHFISFKFNKFISQHFAVYYENLPMQYTEIFLALKNENFQLKKFDSFLIFCSKHRLWVHVRTASALHWPVSETL